MCSGVSVLVFGVSIGPGITCLMFQVGGGGVVCIISSLSQLGRRPHLYSRVGDLWVP